jgi:hypothetical protein
MSIDSLIITIFMTVIASFAVVAIARRDDGPGHSESRSSQRFISDEPDNDA